MSRILLSNGLWKTVDNFGNGSATRITQHGTQTPGCLAASGASHSPLRACSACDGDYEDPDRTARTALGDDDNPDSDEDEDGESAVDSRDGFPATEE